MAWTEHSSGQDGFPPGTIVVRPKVQQQELDETGTAGIETFRSRNDTNRELLADARVGKSDILFDEQLSFDLGDVTARLMWFGPAHSNGDTLAFVEPDGVLVSGDVVQNKAGIGLSGSRAISAEFQSRYAGWTRLNFLERSVIVAYQEP